MAISDDSTKPSRPNVRDIDRHIGGCIRERRIMLGLTQQQAAEMIRVTYQQMEKYEKGTDRIVAGRLYQIGRALGVDVGYFFEGLHSDKPLQTTPQRPDAR